MGVCCFWTGLTQPRDLGRSRRGRGSCRLPGYQEGRTVSGVTFMDWAEAAWRRAGTGHASLLGVPAVKPTPRGPQGPQDRVAGAGFGILGSRHRRERPLVPTQALGEEVDPLIAG